MLAEQVKLKGQVKSDWEIKQVKSAGQVNHVKSAGQKVSWTD